MSLHLYEVAAQPESAPAAPLPRPAIRRWDALREVVELVVLICAIYALVNLSTVRFIVQGPSMEPNFETGQFLIVSRVNYLLGDPQRGDIVVFHYPGNPDEDYIKRVIGLPGDVIEFRGQQVYVNGQLLNEPYINEACSEDMCADRRWELGPDEYFVMGDNRNRSSDSRRFGPVPRTFIVGEVLIRYWPPEDWGIVHQIAYPAGNP